MKIGASILLVLAMVPSVHSHSTEVRHCITNKGLLRVYIQHWHGSQTPMQYDTMDIRDEITGVVSTVQPTGHIENVADFATQLPGCEFTISDAVTDCPGMGDYDDWVWYDFQAKLNVPVKYTLLVGNSVMLMEGCPEILPATVEGVLTLPSDEQVAKQKAAGVYGDPHFLTWSGESFDFHGACDLVLFEKDDLQVKGQKHEVEVNVRTEIRTWWSYIKAAVVRIGDHTFEVRGGLENDYWVDGVKGTVGLEQGSSFSDSACRFFASSSFDVSFHWINNHQRRYRIDVGGGDAIKIDTFKEFVRVDIIANNKKKWDGALGMMGNFPNGIMMARNGTTIISDPIEFGQEWQAKGNLFHNAEGPQFPAKCAMPTVSTQRKLRESSVTREAAEEACAGKEEQELVNCIFDVMATSDISIASVY